MNKKYCFILGTRPEIIKMFSCIKYCEENGLDFFIIHTNQHYSENMDKVFFEELNLPSPKYNLGIGSCTHGHMTGVLLIEIEKILLEEKPDIIIVQGDTNTTLAGGLIASKAGMKLAHIEAGLRSYDRGMPEEINRIVIDHISDYLFVPTQRPKETLLKEGIEENKIFLVGNTVIDAVQYILKQTGKLEKLLEKMGLKENDFLLFTCHRPSNADNKTHLENILQAVTEIGDFSGKKVIFPIHPRTKNSIKKFGLSNLLEKITVIEPLGFNENIFLQSKASMIITDSGGIQEEACMLKKKCLILRENTERPETLEVGGAIIVGSNKERIINGYHELESRNVDWYNPFGDGDSAKHIFKII